MADEQLTAEQLQAAPQVAAAAVEAAAAEPEPARRRASAARAARQRAQEVNITLSEDDAKMIASMLVDEMEARGAFDPPPEMVVAPVAPGAAPAAADASVAAAQEPARPRSWAERFRGA